MSKTRDTPSNVIPCIGYHDKTKQSYNTLSGFVCKYYRMQRMVRKWIRQRRFMLPCHSIHVWHNLRSRVSKLLLLGSASSSFPLKLSFAKFTLCYKIKIFYEFLITSSFKSPVEERGKC